MWLVFRPEEWRGYIKPRSAVAIGAFAAYDLWMLLFPLQGLGLLSTVGPKAIIFWLIPHTFTLAAIAFYLYRGPFEALSQGAVILTALLTALFPWLHTYHRWVLCILGGSSALVFVRSVALLGHTPRPYLASALALILANITLSLITFWDPMPRVTFALLGGLLLLIGGLRIPAFKPEQELSYLYKFLPFIFSFYFLIALLYIFLMPTYIQVAYGEGLENLFYISTVILSVFILPRDRNLVLLLAVIFGLFALSFSHDPHRYGFNLSMYAIQAAVGFADMFCLHLFLQSANIVRSFALGVTVIFLAIVADMPFIYSPRLSAFIMAVGNMALGVSLLVFYFLQKRTAQRAKIVIVKRPASEISSPETNFPLTDRKPSLNGFKARCSPREWEVLERLLQHKSIKCIAQELNISESSVKTYMQRLYQKAAVRNKKELLKKFDLNQ